MNSDNRFNRRQQLSLGTVIMLSPALRLFPSQSVIMAGRASWLCAAAAVPLLLAWLYFMSSFMSHRQSGEGLPEFILRTLGPIAGKITLAVLSLWFLIYGGFVLRSGADRFIVTIYPSSGPAAFSVTMGLIALAAVLKKPRTMVRFARMVKPVLMGVLFLVAFFSLFSLDFSNLLPVTVHDVMPVMRGSVMAVDIVASAVFYICMLEGGCTDGSAGHFGAFSRWLTGSCLLLTMLSVIIVGSFGADLCVRLTKPFFALVRNLVFFKTVERVEALVVMLWIFPDFLLVSAVLYSAQYCLRLIFGKDPTYNGERLTDFSGGRWVIWLCCAVCVAASLFIAPTPASLDFWSATIVPYVSLAIFFVLLPLVYAAGRMRKSI